MKSSSKITLCLVLVALICTLCFAFYGQGAGATQEYLRVHIRANSNSEKDQAIKYEVRDKVVEFFTPIVAETTSKAEAISAIGENLKKAEEVADHVLKNAGFTYGVRAEIKRENFPTRVYDSVTLEAGVYDSLILYLGSGEGDNWWCVVYPPLCFTAGKGNIVYKSKIAEIIRNFFAE